VVAIVDEGDAAGAEAARLDDLGVRAFAVPAPGPAIRAVVAATRLPVLSLGEVSTPDAALAARASDADAVCVIGGLESVAWQHIAAAATATRMQPLATVASRADLEHVGATGARAALLRTATVEEAIAWAAVAPKSIALLAAVDVGDLASLRSLAGRVDAVLVSSAHHRQAEFSAFVAAVDP
jgi:indole-3-glycerol phosphate synthase